MSLKSIELELLRTLPRLNMRPTLDAAKDAGRLLEQARELVPHGEWQHFLKRIGLTQRTAHDYLAVHRHAGDQRPAANMTIKQFLAHIRQVRYLETNSERERVRAEMAAVRGKRRDDCVVANVDCRKYRWPTEVDAVCTDPPWADMPLYEWLAQWTAKTVRPGGAILVQCGVAHLDQVMSIMAASGLTYVWTLAFWYTQSSQAKATRGFRGTWRPMLIYSVGKFRIPEDTMADGYTVKPAPKNHHTWEQPVDAIKYWLGKFCRPGQLVADPFLGSGTTAVACRELGLRFVGTEIDKTTFRVARGRLAKLDVVASPDN